MTYTPTAEDIAWARQLVTLLTDGGLWAFPATGATFRHSLPDRTLTCLDPGTMDAWLWVQTHATFAAINYRVIEPEAPCPS